MDRIISHFIGTNYTNCIDDIETISKNTDFLSILAISFTLLIHITLSTLTIILVE